MNYPSQKATDYRQNDAKRKLDKLNFEGKLPQDWQKGRGDFTEICFPKVKHSFRSYSLAP